MEVQALKALIESWASPANAASWDKSGVQIACEHTECQALAVALDPTPKTVQEAIEKGCDALLTHHPLSLSPSLPNTVNAYYRVLKSALTADLFLYAAHTSLDTNLLGPAGFLARELALSDLTVLEPIAQEGLYGFGLCGTLPTPLPAKQFFATLASILGKRATDTLTGAVPATISRVAYCTGSGASLLAEAASCGAQLYITGDVRYHAALDAESMPLCVLDVGHHSLEEAMMRSFAGVLADKLPLPVTFIPSASPFRLLSLQEDL